MHDSILALCQEYTTELIASEDIQNWGIALRIKRKYFQDLSSRINRMGYKVNNMAKEANSYYFLHITPNETVQEEATIAHRITSDLVIDLYEQALLLDGKEKKKLMIKVKLLSQYVGGYLAQ